MIYALSPSSSITILSNKNEVAYCNLDMCTLVHALLLFLYMPLCQMSPFVHSKSKFINGVKFLLMVSLTYSFNSIRAAEQIQTYLLLNYTHSIKMSRYLSGSNDSKGYFDFENTQNGQHNDEMPPKKIWLYLLLLVHSIVVVFVVFGNVLTIYIWKRLIFDQIQTFFILSFIQIPSVKDSHKPFTDQSLYFWSDHHFTISNHGHKCNVWRSSPWYLGCSSILLMHINQYEYLSLLGIWIHLNCGRNCSNLDNYYVDT